MDTITITDESSSDTIVVSADIANTTVIQVGLPGTIGATGLSAYQVAVINGFSGTQNEWLQSLQGAAAQTILITQTIANTVWIMNHNLGYKPLVQVFNPGDQVIECDIVHISNNQTRCSFNINTSGYAIFI